MAGIGEIRPQTPVWPLGETRNINPTGGNKQMPRRQPNKDHSDKHENDDDHDDTSRIDEYV